MSAYISRLREEAEREAEAVAQLTVAEVKDVRERLTPLEDRLARLLATIPEAVQLEGLSLTSLQASLRGRWRGSCHPGELGMALRRLGFVRRRTWCDENGFRAMWYLNQEM